VVKTKTNEGRKEGKRECEGRRRGQQAWNKGEIDKRRSEVDLRGLHKRRNGLPIPAHQRSRGRSSPKTREKTRQDEVEQEKRNNLYIEALPGEGGGKANKKNKRVGGQGQKGEGQGIKSTLNGPWQAGKKSG